MQSGISAYQELHDSFNALLASDSQFGLLAKIEGEVIKPVHTLAVASPSATFADNVGALAPHLKADEALYVILRRYPTSPSLVAITYVPDAAKVRQKMLFASSRLTLTRDLGSEHFRDTIFATTPDELSAAGFDKLDAHNNLRAPLTEEEQSLGDVKRAEQEAGAGTGVREIHLSKSLKMPFADDAIGAMKELGNGTSRVLVMLKINPETEVVELVSSTDAPASLPELSRTISDTEPRFTFYRFAHDHGGESKTPILFFYTCPATPGNRAIKHRMMYPLMKRAVLSVAASEGGIEPAKSFEIEEPSEITDESVLSELYPKVESKQRFSRPKRPGR